jgi:hypothetical protein
LAQSFEAKMKKISRRGYLRQRPVIKVVINSRRRKRVGSERRRKSKKLVETPERTPERPRTFDLSHRILRQPYKSQPLDSTQTWDIYKYQLLDSDRNEIRLLQLQPLQAWDENQDNQAASNYIEATLSMFL